MTIAAIVLVLLQIAVAIRALLRRHRDPSSRVAWLLVIIAFPGVGILLYLLLGETSIGKDRAARRLRIRQALPDPSKVPGMEAPAAQPRIAEHDAQLFSVGQSISELPPVGGNQGELLTDSNIAIGRMVADIDAATEHVHLCFYIWLPDNNGRKMAEALCRAVSRGVTCRAIVDDIGSRLLIKSDLWSDMNAAGVQLARALPVGNPVAQMLRGRIDLRNHRKIMVVDNRVTYCGSQNCADPEFRIKAKYGPWVDIQLRLTGPVVRQNQFVFASDWMGARDEDIRDLLTSPLPPVTPGFTAQVNATGPTARASATSEMFEAVIWSARKRLTITTPYFVPVGSLMSAICAAGSRGVDTRLILPARNDAFAVAAASRGYYHDLLAAGVRIFEFQPGLLHAKSITVDATTTYLGSANMDRRSFDLNYENNVLLVDAALTAAMYACQQRYLSQSVEVSLDEVRGWSAGKRLYHNTMAILGPVL